MRNSETRVWERLSAFPEAPEDDGSGDLIETSKSFLGLTPSDILTLERVFRDDARRRGLRQYP